MLAGCVEEHGGQVIRGAEGDGSFFVFGTAAGGVAAALAAQRKIEHNEWPDGLALRVRMGLHTGPAVLSGGEHVGISVHIAARVSNAAHGGQILCSAATAAGVEADFRPLGSYVLRGIDEPHELLQVCAPDLEQDFPPPRGAVREGGVRVSVWTRSRAAASQGGDLSRLVITGLDGSPLPASVQLEFARASMGPADSFRLVVRVDGSIDEEFDGLTFGGPSDAVAIVNQHSRVIRLQNP
jgi:hypothetical protein